MCLGNRREIWGWKEQIEWKGRILTESWRVKQKNTEKEREKYCQ
jgi:hypothetical protein